MINVTIDMFYISHMDFTIEEIRMKKMNEGDLGLISEQGPNPSMDNYWVLQHCEIIEV